MKVRQGYFLNFMIALLLVLLWQPTQSASLKSLSQSCLCDTTDNCDLECCCDPECVDSLKSTLAQYDRCNDDNFGIPLCSNFNMTDLHVDDLYSGLRTIYTVVKRLFCVQRVNLIDPTSFYLRTSPDAVVTSTLGTMSVSPASMLRPENISSLNQATINSMFYGSEAGICVRTNSIPSNIGTNGLRECRALLNFGSVGASDILSITSIKSAFPSIRVLSMADSTSLNPSLITAPISSSCNITCSNIVRFLKLFINPDTSAVRQDLSYVIVGDLENVQSPSYIIVKYQYAYLNSDGTFAKPSNVGYKIGSPLQLLKRNQNAAGNTDSYFKALNPLNLAYRKPDGTCRVNNSESSDESLVQLRLGRNQFHTCIGDLSSLYNNLKNSFDLIGMMGSSNAVLADYISIDWPSLTANPDSSNVVLKIYYVKVGSYFNPQYYVAKAVAEILTNTAKEKTLFVQYQEVSSTVTTYIPPPPKVDAYLPNDFLFPFYVAQ